MSPNLVHVWLAVGAALGALLLRWAHPEQVIRSRELVSDMGVAAASVVVVWTAGVFVGAYQASVLGWTLGIPPALVQAISATPTSCVAFGVAAGPTCRYLVRYLKIRADRLIRAKLPPDDSTPPHPLRRWDDTPVPGGKR